MKIDSKKILLELKKNSNVFIDEEITEVSQDIKFNTNTGDSNWFDIGGILYGVSFDGVVMDFEGIPLTKEDLNRNLSIVSVLNAANNIIQ
jgi:hypothetical protein